MKGEAEAVARGPTPYLGAGWAHPLLGGSGRPGPLLCLSYGLRVAHGKILTLDFVPSNSENIDFLPFWNQKQATGTMATC